MTYKKINKLKSILLILFSLLILEHNFTIIFSTRNRPIFLIKTQKEDVFLENKPKTKDMAKIALLSIKQELRKGNFLDNFPQVSDYFKNIQNGSPSSSMGWVLKLFNYSKGLLETTKGLLHLSIFSLKYRLFWLKNEALNMREKLVCTLEGNFSTREATLGKAFVFADLSGAPESIYHSFKVIGILHLIAASSANIYLILAFLKPLLALLEYFLGQKAVAFAKSFAVIMYFLLINRHFNLTDSSPSILRASLTCLLAILALQLFNLAVKRLNLLIIVAIICLSINPFYLQSLGFQLSFLASFIILFYWPYIQKKIAKSTLMFSFIMQFFMWPLLVSYFSSINLIAIPANILISPLVELLTVLYFFFIACKSFSLLVLGNFTSTLIYFVNNIFFNSLKIFESMPGKDILINEHKNLIISTLLLFQLIFISLIYLDKKKFNRKNKYRTLAKWPNYRKSR